MYYATNLKIEMENEVKAIEALKVIKKFASQVDERFERLSVYFADEARVAKDIKIKDSTIIMDCSPVFTDNELDIIPDLYKAIAQNNPCGKFTSHLFYDCGYTEFDCDVTFEEHTLTYYSEFFPEGDAYYCPDDEECGAWITNYEELMEKETFTCPDCGKVYTADELAGERPEITNETWYIK